MTDDAAVGGERARIVVATGNVHKLDEIRSILVSAGVASGAGRGDVSLDLVAMSDLDVPSPVEDGDTFEANALLKARACLAATGLPALADDSGLEVDALGGDPGVHSARYAGDGADDAANNAKLVAALADVPDDARTARFVAVAAFVAPDGTEVVHRGQMPGHIVPAAGDSGFGYDPLFLADVTRDGRTNGELSPAEKDAISHRGDAFRRLAPDLAVWLAAR